jgi:hypothetical protein
VADLLRLVEIDLVDLEQREVALAVLGRADLAFDRVAGPKAEAPHLARAHIDVVRAGQVVGFGRAQEAEPVGQDFEHAIAVDGGVVLGQLLQDREHHVLAAQGAGVLDLHAFGEFKQFGRRLVLQVLEIHRRRRWVVSLGDIVQGSAFLNTVARMEVPERQGSRQKIAINRTWDMPRAGNRFLSMGRK